MLSRVLSLLITLLLGAGCGGGLPHRHSSQTLRLNICSDPPMLDPRQMTDSTSANVLMMIGEGLTRLEEDLTITLAGAKQIDISDDLLTYTFLLRENYWSDGDPVTAYDYGVTWLDQLDPSFPSSFAYKLFIIENAFAAKKGLVPLSEVGIKILDNDVLQIKLSHPTPYFLQLLATPSFFPIHQKCVADHPDWAAGAGPYFTTNGPFQIELWEQNHEILLTKNPYYWDAKNVSLDEVHLLMIEDMQTELYLFEQGEIDLAGAPLSSLPTDSLPTLKNLPTYHQAPSLGIYFLTLNTNVTPLNHPKIRQALAYTICREEITQHILQGEHIPAYSFVPPMPHRPAYPLFSESQDETAKQLFAQALAEMDLQEADLPTLTLSYNVSRSHGQIMQAIAEHWMKLFPLHIQLEVSDWKTHLAKVAHYDYHIARFGWVGDYCDPLAFLEPFQYAENTLTGGANTTGWLDKQYVELVSQGKKQRDLQVREGLLRSAEKRFIQQMPVIPLCFLKHNYLQQPWCEGITILPIGLLDIKKAKVHDSVLY